MQTAPFSLNRSNFYVHVCRSQTEHFKLLADSFSLVPQVFMVSRNHADYPECPWTRLRDGPKTKGPIQHLKETNQQNDETRRQEGGGREC